MGADVPYTALRQREFGDSRYLDIEEPQNSEDRTASSDTPVFHLQYSSYPRKWILMNSCIQPSKTSEAVLLQVSRFQFRWLQELLTFGSANMPEIREHRTEEWASRLGKPKIEDSEHDFASINIRTASDSEAEVFTVGVSVGFGVFFMSMRSAWDSAF